MNHREWIAKCLQLYWGKHVNIDQDIAAYFESMASSLGTAGDMSVSTISTVTSVGDADVDNVFASDFETENTTTGPPPTKKGTVSEKQNSEYREKELRIENMDSEDNTLPSTSPPPTPTHLKSLSEESSVSSESSPVTGNGPQRKKRPLSDDADDSLHGPELGGLDIKDFVAYTRIKGRKGLQREYAQIKEEAPAGTFEESK